MAIVLISAAAPSSAKAAGITFTISPSHGAVQVGSIVPVAVFLSSPDTALNTASAAMSFSADTLEVVSMDTDGSIMDLWVEPPTFSNDTGTLKFGGVAFNPGFKGMYGRLITIRFRAKAAGAAIVRFTSDLVLANDGSGTELPADARATASFTVGSFPTSLNGTTTEGASIGTLANADNGQSMSTDITFSSTTEVIIILLISAVVLTSLYNGYRIRRLEDRNFGAGMNSHEKEALKKLKKDLDAAEDAVGKELKE